jgi:deoxyxylulose-5-phosphate synthase
MSIAENHGGLYKNLKELRDTDGQKQCNFFKAMGLDYYYVKDVHDLEQLIDVFNKVKDTEHPLVVHIHTIKGKGFGEKIARYYGPSDMKVLNYGINKELLDRYVPEELMKKNRLTDVQMVEDILSIIK